MKGKGYWRKERGREGKRRGQGGKGEGGGKGRGGGVCVIGVRGDRRPWSVLSLWIRHCIDVHGVQMTSTMFCGLVTTLLTIGHLALSPSAAPSIASLVNEQGSSASYIQSVTRVANQCQTPLHGHRLRTCCTTHQRTSSQQFYNLLYNKFTTNRQKFAASQHLDMSRCWALALPCGKFLSVGGEFVVQQFVELL